MGINFISSRLHKNSETTHMIHNETIFTKYQIKVSGMDPE